MLGIKWRQGKRRHKAARIEGIKIMRNVRVRRQLKQYETVRAALLGGPQCSWRDVHNLDDAITGLLTKIDRLKVQITKQALEIKGGESCHIA